MNIRPSTEICRNYDEITELCRTTEEPVFLTKNGEVDLVVMDIDTYTRRENMLKLREKLLAAEEDRLHGSKVYTVDEAAEILRQKISEVTGIDE